MLLLTRREGQTIKVGDDITITVCEIRVGQVRIGIDAPDAMDIARDDMVKSKPSVKGLDKIREAALRRAKYGDVLK